MEQSTICPLFLRCLVSRSHYCARPIRFVSRGPSEEVRGSKGGAVVRALASHQCGHMWVEFAVGSLPCSERFFSAYSGFPLSSKTNIFKFRFDQESGRRRTTEWMCYLQIVIYLFIYFILIYLFIYLRSVAYTKILKSETAHTVVYKTSVSHFKVKLIRLFKTQMGRKS